MAITKQMREQLEEFGRAQARTITDAPLEEPKRKEATTMINATHAHHPRITQAPVDRSEPDASVWLQEIDLHFLLVALTRLRRAVALASTVSDLRDELTQRLAAFDACRAPVVAEACERRGLDETQTAAVARIVLGGDQLSVLVAPAGTGKTTTLAAMVDAWQYTGRHILALAPSARAAKELSAATGLPADTVAKYLHENQQSQVDPPANACSSAPW